jgi:putative PEP-CTERM system histidine kinase
MVAFLATDAKVLVIGDVDANRDLYGSLTLPPWLASSTRAWLVLPLIVNAGLVGFVVLGHPRAPRELNWEDFDLLRTIGRQAASYVAEQNATRALAEAREFESFTRRFAFVVHDVKNLTSQLTLLAGNAAKHGHDAAFRADMVATMQEAIGKLNRLLARLRETDSHERRKQPLVPFLRNVLARWHGGATMVRLDADDSEDVTAAFDVERLRTVVNHLIQNAVDAVAEGGSNVLVRLRKHDATAVIDVTDDGPGMSNEFVRDQLFRPFQSTKMGGYGIGVYESRALIQDMDGTLDVITAPGKGTTMRIVLPLDGAARSTAPSSAA